MNFDELRQELKPRLREYVEMITKPSKGKNMYVCPICLSGTGEHHTGAFSLDQNTNFTTYQCFSCGSKGDIFNLIGEYNGETNHVNQLKIACKMFNIPIEMVTNSNQPKAKGKDSKSSEMNQMKHDGKESSEEIKQMNELETKEYQEKQREIEAQIDTWSKNLSKTNYLEARGISPETAERFKIGYNPNKGTLVIPTGQLGDRSYSERIIKEGSNLRYLKTKGMKARLFNPTSLNQSAKSVLIVEGEIDALSVIEAGGEAVGLGGTSGKSLLIELVENLKKKRQQLPPIILALDNDSKGEEASNSLKDALEELHVKTYTFNLYGESKDANEALLNDRELLEILLEKVSTVEGIEAYEKELEKKEYEEKGNALYLLNDFLIEINDSKANTPETPTGFEALDRELNGGLYEGLYILGAQSSLGKTTLALQIAMQIAEQGEKDILFISLEQSANELLAKTISRLTYEIDKELAKSTIEITNGKLVDKYTKAEKQTVDKAIKKLGNFAGRFQILEPMELVTSDYIKKAVEKHIRIEHRTPVVIVDYLQMIAPTDYKQSDKQKLDEAVLALKRISRDYKTPVIAISSLNRQGYGQRVSESSYKESGSIEYSADILLGLQFTAQRKGDIDADNYLAEKRKETREVSLVILKNRNGRIGGEINFNYTPKYNYFSEIGLDTEPNSINFDNEPYDL